MERPVIKLGILTSTRADFGIYQPLLKVLASSMETINTQLIVFGTHLSPYHGYTIQEIDKYPDFTIHKVYGMPLSDTPQAIAAAYGHLLAAFSQFWATHDFDWVLALGDRYEISAAVQAGIPMQLKIAHIHGGETTLGAIDNIYRHQISLASKLHFVATDTFAQRVKELTHSPAVYTVGALSLDGMLDLPIPAWEDVKQQFNLPIDHFVLTTFHPETVSYQSNKAFSMLAKKVIAALSQQIPVIITLPNADTSGSLYRHAFEQLQQEYPGRIFLVESFGKLNYFAAMQQCQYLLGNTSSGIIEAASFGKYVVNVGDRQKGRPQSQNIIDVPFDEKLIIEACTKANALGQYHGENIYQKPNTANHIIEHLIHAAF